MKIKYKNMLLSKWVNLRIVQNFSYYLWNYCTIFFARGEKRWKLKRPFVFLPSLPIINYNLPTLITKISVTKVSLFMHNPNTRIEIKSWPKKKFGFARPFPS